MSARCPQCRYLVAQPGLCAVCQSRVPVQVVTDLPPLSLPRVGDFGIISMQSLPPSQVLHCQVEGCSSTVTIDPRGLATIRKRRVLVRCEAHRRQHHRQHRATKGRQEVRMG